MPGDPGAASNRGRTATRRAAASIDALVGEPCARCGRSLTGRSAFVLGGAPRCLGCTLRDRPLLCRSCLTALVVVSVLVAINQGTALAAGQVPATLLWQVPLTYAVPFCVATWGALSNNRRVVPGPLQGR